MFFAILLACGRTDQFQEPKMKQVSNIWKASNFCKEISKYFQVQLLIPTLLTEECAQHRNGWKYPWHWFFFISNVQGNFWIQHTFTSILAKPTTPSNTQNNYLFPMNERNPLVWTGKTILSGDNKQKIFFHHCYGNTTFAKNLVSLYPKQCFFKKNNQRALLH